MIFTWLQQVHDVCGSDSASGCNGIPSSMLPSARSLALARLTQGAATFSIWAQ
jgi:hypothetical protein